MSAREIRILLADDDQIIRGGLTNLLNAQEGLRVVATAVNGAQVFDQLALHRVDVVLLDVDMPVMSGIEAARRISHEQPSITIIMLTAFEHEESLGQAIGAGVRGFLTKDISAPPRTRPAHPQSIRWTASDGTPAYRNPHRILRRNSREPGEIRGLYQRRKHPARSPASHVPATAESLCQQKHSSANRAHRSNRAILCLRYPHPHRLRHPRRTCHYRRQSRNPRITTPVILSK